MSTGHARPRTRTRTHAHTHTQLDPHKGSLLWKSDRFVQVAGVYTTHSKHKRRTPMSSVGFESAFLAMKRLQTYTLDRTATGIAWGFHHSLNKSFLLSFIKSIVKLNDLFRNIRFRRKIRAFWYSTDVSSIICYTSKTTSMQIFINYPAPDCQ